MHGPIIRQNHLAGVQLFGDVVGFSSESFSICSMRCKKDCGDLDDHAVYDCVAITSAVLFPARLPTQLHPEIDAKVAMQECE
ncbi:hypothetical protein [Aquitalea magnusonii]|uniref:hypothetical protein n=1 Tax=Aquitalea magnusonii TaxID=332411 RepID=UPI0007503D6F|nr:hypothetical protein [Aquitalea magnusonii]